MDIHFISPSAIYELTKYCESNLLAEVTVHFAANATIVVSENSNSQPTRYMIGSKAGLAHTDFAPSAI